MSCQTKILAELQKQCIAEVRSEMALTLTLSNGYEALIQQSTDVVVKIDAFWFGQLSISYCFIFYFLTEIIKLLQNYNKTAS